MALQGSQSSSIFPSWPSLELEGSAISPGWGTEANPGLHSHPASPGKTGVLMLVKLLVPGPPHPVFVLSQEAPKFS